MSPLATLSIKKWGTAIISVVLATTVAAVGYFKTSAQREGPDPRADQAEERLIEKRTNSAIPNEPVAITLAKTKKGVVEFGKPFKDDDNDWLKGFTLTAKNISQKAITYIEVTYSFERAKDDANRDQPVLVDTLTYGSMANKSNTMRLNPGESTDLVLSDSTHDFLKKALAQAGYPPSIKHIRFYLSQVNFEDGTMWSLGYWYQRDPAKSDNWIRIPEVRNRVDPERGRPAIARVALRSHAVALRLGLSIASMISSPQISNPCQDPGFPSWIKCDGAASDMCMRKVQPTLPSQITHSHRDKPVVMPCKQCVLIGSSLECDNVPHCADIVLAPSTLPELCPTAGTCGGLPDYATYPSTGCVSGLTVIDGVCTRSYEFQSRCAEPSGYDSQTCTCPDGINTSPIVIDVNGTGFFMTDAVDGVLFNILNDGVPLQISWTATGSSNAFLALDRNKNGVIDNGAELFGDLTPQPPTAKPNGFLALAEYDKPANGGNGDGRIDRPDAIFSELKLWQDSNHNGISEPNELRPVSELLSAIDLAYRESRRIDQYGNQFRYRSRVFDVNGVQAGRWAWDVFLMVQ